MALAEAHLRNVLARPASEGLPLDGMFVVGCPRSGTTLLQTLLAANPLLTTFSESDFFGRNFRKFPKYPVYYTIRNPAQHICKFIEDNGESPRKYDDMVKCLAKLARYYPPDAIRATVVFLHLLNSITHGRKAVVWLEKSPVHLWFLPLIEKASERAQTPVRVVHIVRDGRDVVASLYEASRHWHEGGYTIQQCVRRWNRDILATLRRVRGKPHDLVVAYEDLVANPRKIVDLIYDELGVPNDAPRRDYKMVARGIGATNKIIHSRLEGTIKLSSKFERIFDQTQKEEIVRSLNLEALAELRRTFVLTCPNKNHG